MGKSSDYAAICAGILGDPKMREAAQASAKKISEKLCTASHEEYEQLRSASRLTDNDYKTRINARD